MDYLKIYVNIINKAKFENRKSGCKIYYENHHILPKCMGGNDEKENLVLLTAKEHFICHKLLVEIYPNKKGLIYACMIMCNKISSSNKRDYIVSSIEYERVRHLYHEKCSGENHYMFGKKHSEKTKEKLRQINLGDNNPMFNKKAWNKGLPKEQQPMFGRCGELSLNFGKKASQETKDKLSKMRKGVILSKEHKEKISKSRMGQKYERVECPHCDKIIDPGNAKKWHFDNCKLKVA